MFQDQRSTQDNRKWFRGINISVQSHRTVCPGASFTKPWSFVSLVILAIINTQGRCWRINVCWLSVDNYSTKHMLTCKVQNWFSFAYYRPNGKCLQKIWRYRDVSKNKLEAGLYVTSSYNSIYKFSSSWSCYNYWLVLDYFLLEYQELNRNSL